eukprot:COSAG06_NODE_1181_length_10363_cov_10.391563_1_plen_44_part_00
MSGMAVLLRSAFMLIGAYSFWAVPAMAFDNGAARTPVLGWSTW